MYDTPGNHSYSYYSFMEHCLVLNQAFQEVDVGPNKNTVVSDVHTPGDNLKTKPSLKADRKHGSRATRDPPVRLFDTHRVAGIRHLLKDCTECPEEKKKVLLDKYRAEKKSDGPARNTRSQTSRHVGRLVNKQPTMKINDMDTSCPVRLADGSVSVMETGRCDDGSDATIVSPKIAEMAVVKGVGMIYGIKPVKLQVALKDGDQAQEFTCVRPWKRPRVVLQLAAGKLALLNVTFLVTDGDLSSDDLLIGLPLLRHLCVDTRTLLERNSASLDGTDCNDVPGATTDDACTPIGRLVKTTAEINPGRDKNRPRANYYETRATGDEFPNPYLLEPMVDGSEDKKVREALDLTLKEAYDNGLPSENKDELRAIVDDNIAVFCTTSSDGPPAAVKPLKINLASDVRPVRVKLRNYSQEQRKFLKKMVADFIKCKMVYLNPFPTWACAPLLVPKSGPAKFRFTVDLRPVNKFTLKHGYLMPNVEQELQSITGSKVYAKFDLSHGYWQFPLHEDSQECQSFVIPDGVYTPTRVLHGTTNAVTYLQSTIATLVPAELISQVLFWLDDILIHHATLYGLLSAISKQLTLFKTINIKLHPEKCCFFSTSIRWCGRLLSRDGIRFDPRRIDGIQKIELPKTGCQLQQFVCALQWVKTAIPNFTMIVEPLHLFMKTVYDRAGVRTKRGVSKVLLSPLGWSEKEKAAFHNCRSALAKQVALAHRKQDDRLCV